MSGSLRVLNAVACLIALTLNACGSKGGDGGTGPGPGPTPTIALVLGAAGGSVVAGGNTTVSATITRGGGYAGTIVFSVEGAPAGVTGGVSNVVNSGTTTSATITITAVGTVAPGTYNLTVRGSGAGVTATTAPFQLVVTAAPDFALSLGSAAVSVVQGTASAPIAVNIARTNFSDAVTLGLTGMPTGVTAAFSDPAPTGTTSNLTVTVAAAVAPGTYPLSVTGTGAPGGRSTPLVLTVTAAGSFSLSVGPAGTVSLQQGASDNSRTVTINRTNYGAPVTLSAENLPPGVTATFGPNPITGNTAVLSLHADEAVPVGGPFTITIRGTGPIAIKTPGTPAAVEATATVSLSITPLGTFTLSLAPSCNATMLQGAYDDRRVISVTRTNFPLPINLAVANLPAGLSATFAGNPITGNTARLVLTTSGTVAPGTYNLAIHGTLAAASLRAPGAARLIDVSIPLQLAIVATAPPDPSLQEFLFNTDTFEGWAPGFSCTRLAAPSWGNVISQESMIVLDGVGVPGEADGWVSRVINVSPSAAVLQFDVSGHPVNGADARLQVRVVDAGVSTVIFNQVITGSAPVRNFSTRTADISPWKGKTVRILFEQDANGFLGNPAIDNAEQIWIDNIRILSGLSNLWQVRQPLTVSTGGSAAPAQYSVAVQLDHAALVTAGKSLASGNDLRVVYWDGVKLFELDRALDPGSAWNTGTTKIWFKTQALIPAGGSDPNYYIYYGNPAAGAPPENRARVFLFHEHFESNSFGKWDGNGAWVIDHARTHGGTTSARYDAEAPSVRSATANAPTLQVADVYLESWWYLNSASSGYKMNLAVRTQPNGDSYQLVLNDPPFGWGIAKVVGGVFTQLVTVPGAPPINSWIRVGIGIQGGTARIFVNGAEIGSTGGLTQLLTGNVGMGKLEIPVGASWWSDDVVARRYVNPEPGSSLGAGQPGPFPGGPAWLRLP